MDRDLSAVLAAEVRHTLRAVLPHLRHLYGVLTGLLRCIGSPPFDSVPRDRLRDAIERLEELHVKAGPPPRSGTILKALLDTHADAMKRKREIFGNQESSSPRPYPNFIDFGFNPHTYTCSIPDAGESFTFSERKPKPPPKGVKVKRLVRPGPVYDSIMAKVLERRLEQQGWSARVDVEFSFNGPTTTCRVEADLFSPPDLLTTGKRYRCTGYGVSRCNPTDDYYEEIGKQLAFKRAAHFIVDALAL